MAGIRVYRGAVPPPDAGVLDTIVDAHTKSMECIFNPDRKRRQVRGIDTQLPLVKELVRALTERGELEGRVVGDVTLLHSLAGCKRQRWHQDYDPDRLDQIPEDERWPCGVLCAVQDGTFFESHRHGRYCLNAGVILVFDANTVHAGAAYREPNVRLHMYLDTPRYRLTEDETYLLVDDDNPGPEEAAEAGQGGVGVGGAAAKKKRRRA